MGEYHRIMTVIDLTARGRETARLAWSRALKGGARLCLGHVVDWDHGNGDFSVLTPSEIESRLEGVVKRKLMEIADVIGAPKSSICVGFAGPKRGLPAIVQGWQPDLLMVDARYDFGLGKDPASSVPGWECDILVTDAHPSGLPFAKLIQNLVQTLPPGQTATWVKSPGG